MAQTPQYRPNTEEAISTPIAGISSVISKISKALEMETSTFTDLPMTEVFIAEDDRNRIFAVNSDKSNWLETPAPVIKKNNIIISPSVDGFKINYQGGSIEFTSGSRPASEDILTVTATYINEYSSVLKEISNNLTKITTQISSYKGDYTTLENLKIAYPQAELGDYALITGPEDMFYVWDLETADWKATHSDVDLSHLATTTELSEGLATKEPTIDKHGTGTSSDNYYYSGRKGWIDVFNKIRNTVLSGFNLDISSSVTSADTLIVALGKIQAQLNRKEPTITTKRTAFNKDFGTTVGTIAQGNDDRFINRYNQNNNTLTGQGSMGKFKAATTASYSAFSIGGVSYSVKQGEEVSIDLIKDNWYTFILDSSNNTINFNQGGSTPNYKVIASTVRPTSNLKENTIWVNTSTPIPKNGYAFSSANLNTSPQVGEVWFKTGVNSNAPFSTDKKVKEMQYVQNAYQWSGSAWLRKSCEIYQKGKWISLVGKLIKDGVSYIGEMIGTGYSQTNTAQKRYELWANNQQNTTYKRTFTQKITVSGYNTLVIDFQRIANANNGSAEIQLVSDAGVVVAHWNDRYDSGQANLSRRDITLPIPTGLTSMKLRVDAYDNYSWGESGDGRIAIYNATLS